MKNRKKFKKSPPETNMNIKRLVLTLGVLVFCLSLNRLAAAQGSGELSVLSSNLSQSVISELIPTFEKIYRIKVRVNLKILKHCRVSRSSASRVKPTKSILS